MSTVQLPARITGSWLAAIGSGLPLHKGLVDTVPGSWCCYCGHSFAIEEKAHVDTNIDSVSFNDPSSMAGNGSGLMCDACAVVLAGGKLFMQTYQKGYATIHGIWPLRSNTDIANFILHPPNPPFVAVVGLAQQTHTFWRTPVAHSTDVFPIRVGTTVGMVRRELVLQVFNAGFEICEQAMLYDAERRQAENKRPRASAAKKTFRSHPYIRLDREMADPAHGQVKPVVERFLSTKPHEPPYSLIGEMNSHESWFLSALFNLKPGADIHTTPPPMATSSEKTLIGY